MGSYPLLRMRIHVETPPDGAETVQKGVSIRDTHGNTVISLSRFLGLFISKLLKHLQILEYIDLLVVTVADLLQSSELEYQAVICEN